jgi:hypothetical protein
MLKGMLFEKKVDTVPGLRWKDIFVMMVFMNHELLDCEISYIDRPIEPNDVSFYGCA